MAETVKTAMDSQGGASSLAQVEARVRETALAFAAKIVGELMSGPLQGAAGVGSPEGRRELRTARILSSVGEVSYTRWYVSDAGGNRGFPADEALGIVRGCTPGAAKMLCHEAAKSQSYADASESAALLSGIRVSQNTIQRLVGAVGPDMAAWADERAPATVQPGRDIVVCLEMDMTGVRLLKKYLTGARGRDGPAKGRQIKCGVAFLLERGGDGLYRKVPGSSVHILSFGTVTDFSAALDKARAKLGAAYDTGMIVIADGAEWIWNIAADRFAGASGIVDFWHAAEHLNGLCEFVHGRGDTAGENFKALRRKLKRHGVDCVIRHFECMAASKVKRYFINHRKRMQYHLYRREGWPIGSGEVEGACRSLVKQRTDLSGQRWSPEGALNVLWVRALIKDGLHDQYWNTQRNRSKNKAAA